MDECDNIVVISIDLQLAIWYRRTFRALQMHYTKSARLSERVYPDSINPLYYPHPGHKQRSRSSASVSNALLTPQNSIPHPLSTPTHPPTPPHPPPAPAPPPQQLSSALAAHPLSLAPPRHPQRASARAPGPWAEPLRRPRRLSSWRAPAPPASSRSRALRRRRRSQRAPQPRASRRRGRVRRHRRRHLATRRPRPTARR